MIDNKSLNTLEYNKILEMLADFAQSEGGKTNARALVPFERLEDAEKSLSETAEADKVLFNYAVSPTFAVDNIAEILMKCKKGATLAIAELLKVGRALRVSRRLEKSISPINGIPILSEMCSRLFFNDELERAIFDAFLSETEVSDNASYELKMIRAKIRKLNEGVRAKLQSFITAPAYSKYLQDSIITMRGDRYVIPIKSDCKGSIAGLIHDQSASGSTLFVEPMQVVELNNDLKIEKMNEQAEIERILRNFSATVAGFADNMTWCYEVMVDMDLIFAKAQLSRTFRAVRPTLNDKGIIKIKNGRHPLIDATKVVPISLIINQRDNMLLITGPNTGGKTVTLKLVGLFVVMGMSGLYVPALDAELSIFDGVYSDIGDEQSIEQSLSTFSSHIKNIIDILDRVTDNSLVLFDELGSGTDPSEGAALAVAIAERILELGATALVTSHFNDLKEFALTKEGVVVASMEFDIQTLSPTFRLVMNAIGSSNALDIASRLGLSETIVNNARSKISVEKRQFDRVLNAAEETRRHAELLVGEASKDREKVATALIDAEKEKKLVVDKREKLDEIIRKDTKHLIDESVGEANDIIEELKKLLDKEVVIEADIFVARKLKKKLENMSAEYDRELIAIDTPDHSPLKIGDNVWVKSIGKKGKLAKLTTKEAEICFGKINMKAKIGDFFKVK